MIGDKVNARKSEPQGVTRVSLLEKADLPQARETTKQVKVAGVAAAALFFLGLFGVGWWEYSARKINNVDEVVRGLGLSVVGTLPAVPESARRRLAGPNAPGDLYWQSLLTESVDATRTMLLHAAEVEGLRVVMVTSAAGGEGKTSLASHLATSLARA